MSTAEEPGAEGLTRAVTRENVRWLALLLSPSHDPEAQSKARDLADEWFDALAATPAADSRTECRASRDDFDRCATHGGHIDVARTGCDRATDTASPAETNAAWFDGYRQAISDIRHHQSEYRPRPMFLHDDDDPA